MFKYFIAAFVCMTCSYAQSPLIGKYDLTVKIGENIFIDILSIERIKDSFITGRFIVPGVFDSKFEGRATDKVINGNFIARERGGEFNVSLRATIISKCKLRGSLSTEERDFASFVGSKRSCHE